MLNGKTILLTGGTGSFGKRFVEMTLKMYSPKKIIIYSRDEMKQWDMAEQFKNEPRLRFFIGDVRDKDRLKRACNGVDIIVHAAALKIITSAEYNPFECVKTNILGAMNIVDCAIDANVKRVIALSTDKACNPVNLYGATKLCSDKLFIAANVYSGYQETRFAVVRYGNVMGSRGSVIPFFRSLAEKGEIPITDKRMTRFMIRLEEAVELVWKAVEDCLGGEIYVPKIPSMKVVDIAQMIAPNAKLNFIGIRPGEKLHEQMISVEEARSTYEFDHYYKVMPQIQVSHPLVTRIEERNSPIRSGKRVPPDFTYSSDSNSWFMSNEDLQTWISSEFDQESPAAQAPMTAQLSGASEACSQLD